MRNTFVISALLAVACGARGADSPESLARSVFANVADGNRESFLSNQLSVADMEKHCTDLGEASRSEIAAEVAVARMEAIEAYQACRAIGDLTGTRFVRSERSPPKIVPFRWPGCPDVLSFDFLRVHFSGDGRTGTLLITDVANIGDRWLFKGAVRLCEFSAP